MEAVQLFDEMVQAGLTIRSSRNMLLIEGPKAQIAAFRSHIVKHKVALLSAAKLAAQVIATASKGAAHGRR